MLGSHNDWDAYTIVVGKPEGEFTWKNWAHVRNNKKGLYWKCVRLRAGFAWIKMRTNVELFVNTVMKLRIPSKARNLVDCLATIRFSGIILIILLGVTKYKDGKGVYYVLCMYVYLCIGPTGWGKVVVHLSEVRYKLDWKSQLWIYSTTGLKCGVPWVGTAWQEVTCTTWSVLFMGLLTSAQRSAFLSQVQGNFSLICAYDPDVSRITRTYLWGFTQNCTVTISCDVRNSVPTTTFLASYVRC